PERLDIWIRRVSGQQKAEPVNPRCLLSLGHERRSEDAPTHHSDERSPVHHWMSSLARTRTDCGIVSPSVLAVLALTTNSNLVGCSTGRSPGFAPFKILST